MSSDVQDAIEHRDNFGHCILEGSIPADLADSMAKRLLEIHADPECQQYNTGNEY